LSLSGGKPYSNTFFYREFIAEPTANVFKLNLSFWLPGTTCNNQPNTSAIQALEFSMNKYQDAKRYEFAVQWQNVQQAAGDGAPQWRYWDGSRWQAMNPMVPQCLTSGWHALILEGDISNGQVHYRAFTIDRQRHSLGNITVPPVSV
jgi:hypothetical protein